MNTRNIITAALLGTAGLGGLAATAASDTGSAKRAAAEYKAASKALEKHKVDKAISAAESAVALEPRNAGYRTLLGQAYLAAGRFPSAVGALSDALSLDPANGPAALHLALAQIATGNWGGARETLTAHDATIPASDRGLAFALAGDPVTAVTLLTAAAREPGADAKTRQNLALSLALAGRWNEAKTVAALDMAPAEVDARIMQWAAFARPSGAADQVASLLGVVPIVDGGQPERLALNTTSPTMAATAQPVDPVEAFMPTQVADAAPAPAIEAAPVLASVSDATGVTFAPHRAVVQPLPVSRRVVPQAVAPRAAATPPGPVAQRALAKGAYYVQLGAYQNAGVARDAWGRLSRRVASLDGLSPQGTKVTARGQDLYRLSVGGFARGDADTLCRRVRMSGGVCFVRAGAGDQLAAWSARGAQLASR